VSTLRLFAGCSRCRLPSAFSFSKGRSTGFSRFAD
jgi:hypothetical protein